MGFTSAITVAELSVVRYRKDTQTFITHRCDGSDARDCDSWWRIYAELSKKGEEIELNDCLIASTALSLGIHEIVTRDLDHFNRIENIKAITPAQLVLFEDFEFYFRFIGYHDPGSLGV